MVLALVSAALTQTSSLLLFYRPQISLLGSALHIARLVGKDREHAFYSHRNRHPEMDDSPPYGQPFISFCRRRTQSLLYKLKDSVGFKFCTSKMKVDVLEY